MPAGRRPKPSALKIVNGKNADEPQPEVVLPKPPRHLSAVAKKEWKRITPLLFDMKVLAEIDTVALAAYCNAFARWREAEDKVAEEGMIVKAPSGYPIQSPYLAIANKALEQMHKLLIEFGMTPASRTKVKSDTPSQSGAKSVESRWAKYR